MGLGRDFGALSHNRIFPHSTRGEVNNQYEGNAYCVKCHLTVEAMDNYNANGEYTDFRDEHGSSRDRQNYNFLVDDNLFPLLQAEIGLNPGQPEQQSLLRPHGGGSRAPACSCSTTRAALSTRLMRTRTGSTARMARRPTTSTSTTWRTIWTMIVNPLTGASNASLTHLHRHG